MIQVVSCVTVVFILLSLLKTRLSGGTSGASEPSGWDTFASEAQFEQHGWRIQPNSTDEKIDLF